MLLRERDNYDTIDLAERPRQSDGMPGAGGRPTRVARTHRYRDYGTKMQLAAQRELLELKQPGSGVTDEALAPFVMRWNRRMPVFSKAPWPTGHWDSLEGRFVEP
jgi:hypothetical protein